MLNLFRSTLFGAVNLKGAVDVLMQQAEVLVVVAQSMVAVIAATINTAVNHLIVAYSAVTKLIMMDTGGCAVRLQQSDIRYRGKSTLYKIVQFFEDTSNFQTYLATHASSYSFLLHFLFPFCLTSFVTPLLTFPLFRS